VRDRFLSLELVLPLDGFLLLVECWLWCDLLWLLLLRLLRVLSRCDGDLRVLFGGGGGGMGCVGGGGNGWF